MSRRPSSAASPSSCRLIAWNLAFWAGFGCLATVAAAQSANPAWKPSNNSNPFRDDTATQWSPVRTPQQPAAQPARTAPVATARSTPAYTTPTRPVAGNPAASAPLKLSSSPATATTRPASSPTWRLPNQQQPADNAAAQAAANERDDDSNGHSNGDSNRVQPAAFPTAASTMREPKPFTPPSGAMQIPSTSAARGNPRATSTAGTGSPPAGAPRSAANAQPPQSRAMSTSANMNAGPHTYRNQNNVPNQRTTNANPGRNMASARGRAKSTSHSSRVWDSITVAFQQPESWTESESEVLPSPGMRGGHAPMMQGGEYDMGYGGCSDGSCNSYGGPACGCNGGCAECGPMCGDGMCGCGGACGCGCEVGCACEPGCGCPSGGCDINMCGQGDPAACTTIRIGVPKWQEFMVFGGVQGFKGPYDQARDSGNFGFNEGFNAGFKMPFTTMGYQIGYRAVHSQLSGDKDTDISDPHTQQFLTVGMFQRVKDGLQGGIAYDVLRDERWGAVDFHQLRGVLSMIDHGCHEWGIDVAIHLNDDEQFFVDQNENFFSTLYQASDQYLFFYRFHSYRGGEGRFFGGFNDDSDGIIGADMLLPLQDRWSLQAGFTYLIPDEKAGFDGASQEAWNIGLALIWHWDCRARRMHSNCYRPMFNVADNGSMIIDDRPGRQFFNGD